MDQTIRKQTKRTPSPRQKSKKRKKAVQPIYVLTPDRTSIGKAGTLFGMIGRALIPFVGTLGLILFVYDAFMLEIPVWQPALFSAVFTLLFTVCSLGIIPCIVSLGVTALGLGTAALIAGKSPQFLVFGVYNSVVTFINGIMERLNLVGYRSIGALKLKDLPGISADKLIDVDYSQYYLAAACAMIALILSLLMVSCTVRRVRLLPIIAVCGSVMVVIFTYNISITNWGFALIIIALVGLLTLKIYDSTFNRTHPYTDAVPDKDKTEKPRKFAKIAPGGFTSAFAMFLSAVILIPTAANTTENWMLIDPINDRLAYIRAVVSSIIIGDVPNLGDLGYLGNMDTLNSRTTEASDRTFTGEVILEVQAAYNTPVYLRSWVGTYYREDSWYSASSTDVDYYHDKLYGEDFSPEDITWRILNAVDPSLLDMKNMSSYVNHTDLGYLTMCIDVKNVSSSGNLLFIPSMMNPDIGLLEPGTTDPTVKYDGPWKDYHEGIVTSSWFNFDKAYRTVSMVPTYRNVEFDNEVTKLAQYYDLMTRYIFMNHDLYDAKKIEETVKFVNAAADRIGYDYYKPSLIERYFAMTPAERDDFIYEHYSVYKAYQQYVDQFYLWLPQNESLDIITSEIFPAHASISADGSAIMIESGLYNIYYDPETGKPYETTHDMVMRVIEYLGENYTYTHTPKAPTRRNTPALDAFLTDTKEGYCVQFATAATMLLRNIGIPARYVEGYIASEFIRNPAKEKLGSYITEVCDYDAHAWIEVWIDGYGWMQYEVTPSYYDSMYKPLSSTTSSNKTNSYITEEETVIEEEETETEIVIEEVIDISMFVPLFVSLPVVLGIVIAVFMILGVRDRARKRREKRSEIIRASRSSPDSEDSAVLARQLSDCIMQVLGIVGLTPDDGELPSEYALRADKLLSEPSAGRKRKRKKPKGIDIAALTETEETGDTVSSIMPTIQKAQFSGGSVTVTHSELHDLCTCLDEVTAQVYSSLNPLKKFWLRKVRGVI